MNARTFLPLIAAAIGFAVAWTVKPAAEKPAPVSANPAAAANPAKPPLRPAREESGSRFGRAPVEVHAADFPLADAAANGPQTALEGKMLRLSEVLGLSVDQQGKITAALEAARAAAVDGVPVLEEMAARGRMVEAELEKILSPEQFAKFQEVRSRERDNRIEKKAQELLGQAIERIDLSPGQREELLARLRQYQREEFQAVPAAATLLFNTSILPTDPRDPGVDGVLALAEIEKSGQNTPASAQEAHDRVIAMQKEALEEKLRCFDGVLTPGQMGQYHAVLNEQRRTLEEMQRKAQEQRARSIREHLEKTAAENPETE